MCFCIWPLDFKVVDVWIFGSRHSEPSQVICNLWSFTWIPYAQPPCSWDRGKAAMTGLEVVYTFNGPPNLDDPFSSCTLLPSEHQGFNTKFSQVTKSPQAVSKRATFTVLDPLVPLHSMSRPLEGGPSGKTLLALRGRTSRTIVPTTDKCTFPLRYHEHILVHGTSKICMERRSTASKTAANLTEPLDTVPELRFRISFRLLAISPSP